MKRATFAVLVSFCLCVIASQAIAKPVPQWLKEQCRFEKLDEHTGYSVTEVKRTIRCATWRWWRGHIATVNYIADKESSFYEYADNPSSSAAGVFQVIDSTWQGWRFVHWAERAEKYKLSTSVYDARANVMVAVWQMGQYGLGPWGM